MKTISDYTDNEVHETWFEEIFLEDLGKTFDEVTIEDLKAEIKRTEDGIAQESIYIGITSYARHNIADMEDYIDVLKEIISDKEETK